MNSGYIFTGESIIVHHEGKVHTILKSNARIDEIKESIKAGDYDEAIRLFSIKEVINEFGKGKIVVRDGEVWYGNEVLHNAATEHVVRMVEEGFDVAPMVNFLDNLMENPSKQSVDELYGFISAAKIAITPDGHLLAYKKVRKNANGDLVDIYTGTITNNVGSVVEQPRNTVNDNRHETCSSGLHFCSMSYLPHFGYGSADFVVILKINPRDVVSIPVDYKNAKGRCCRYEVVEMHPYDMYTESLNKAVIDVKTHFHGEDAYDSEEEYNYDDSDDYDTAAEELLAEGEGYYEKGKADFENGVVFKKLENVSYMLADAYEEGYLDAEEEYLREYENEYYYGDEGA